MKTKLFFYFISIFMAGVMFYGFNVKDNPTNSEVTSTSVTQPDLDQQPVSTLACPLTFSLQVSGTASQLFTTCAVSNLVGWAAGVGSTVRKTINGGTTWTDGNSSPGVITGDIYNIWAIDANTAFVTTTPGATFIYRTINGGATWTQVFTQAGGFIDGIQMINAMEGYAMGDPVGGKWTILKTIDGGASWARMATEPVQVGAEAGWNNSWLIIGTHMWMGTNNTRVYHSTNLGVTWSFGATTGTLNTFAVHFNDLSNGLAGGGAAATPMVKTNNGGSTYSQTTNYPGAAGNQDGLEGAGSDWWAIRTDANVYYTANQGATPWVIAHTQAGAVFQDIDFNTDGCPTGWVVGNAGVIVRMGWTATSTLTLKVLIEGMWSGTNVPDVIPVTLRNVTSPYAIVDGASGMNDAAGNVSLQFGNVVNGTPYYIVVDHRNSIETWSKSGGETFVAGALAFDFTTAASQAFGSNLALKNAKFVVYKRSMLQKDDFVSPIFVRYNKGTVFKLKPARFGVSGLAVEPILNMVISIR
jgi:photosystem II stability/assembly factor-like uncharacterized protein